MQDKSVRRSNRDRTQATRAALIAAARTLFCDKGYAGTGTVEIAAAAKVTRGALYHHFSDKSDLFHAVVAHEAEVVAEQIARQTRNPASALEALMTGTEAYFAAMAAPGRTRLLLLDGPSVLGHAEMDRINGQTSGEKLRQGLGQAMSKKALENVPLEALTDLFSAAFDRAALAIAEGRPAKSYIEAIRLMLTNVTRSQDF